VAKVPYVILGRAPDCDVVISGTSVSSRHARMRWQQGALLIEDLGSSNGTFVDGEKVSRARELRVGQDVRLGVEMLPWDEPKLRAFLRHGASDTIVAAPRFGRYRCTKCKKTALVPVGLKHGEITCTHCGAGLLIGHRPLNTGWWLQALSGAAVVLLTSAVVVGFILRRERSAESKQRSAGESVLEPLMPESMRIAPSKNPDDISYEELSIRESGTARRVVEAIDTAEPATRNLAVQVAAKTQGPFHVEQVAAIWLHVRARFNYVNDPRGSEYFAKASETIGNGFAGDCDDFAIALSAMTAAIGGRVRVVIMDGARGGHAYAEACVESTQPAEVATRLRRYARKHWDKRLGAVPALANVYYRSDDGCPMWLNLDWNANVPAGPYEDERWAVAIEPDGATLTLAPADAPKKATTGRKVTAR
jgi:DNA-directed RNA polymerase subunit RPC12/RpoP